MVLVFFFSHTCISFLSSFFSLGDGPIKTEICLNRYSQKKTKTTRATLSRMEANRRSQNSAKWLLICCFTSTVNN